MESNINRTSAEVYTYTSWNWNSIPSKKANVPYIYICTCAAKFYPIRSTCFHWPNRPVHRLHREFHVCQSLFRLKQWYTFMNNITRYPVYRGPTSTHTRVCVCVAGNKHKSKFTRRALGNQLGFANKVCTGKCV